MASINEFDATMLRVCGQTARVNNINNASCFSEAPSSGTRLTGHERMGGGVHGCLAVYVLMCCSHNKSEAWIDNSASWPIEMEEQQQHNTID